MVKIKIILVFFVFCQTRLGIGQTQANFVPLGSIGSRLENGSGRDLSMSGATMSNHRSQYVSFQNPALLSLNKISYVVSNNFKYTRNGKNQRDQLKVDNLLVSINNLAFYTALTHNFENSYERAVSQGTIHSLNAGSIREFSFAFGHAIIKSLGNGVEDLEKTQEPKKLGQGVKLESLHLGINSGILNGNLLDTQKFTGINMLSDSLMSSNDRKLDRAFFVKPGLLIKYSHNNRYEINMGVTYHHTFKSRTILNQFSTNGDSITNIESSGTFKYPDFLKIGLSYARPYSREFQWVIEASYEYQYLSSLRASFIDKRVGDYMAVALGIEARIKGIIARFGSKFGSHRDVSNVVDTIGSLPIQPIAGSEIWQFSAGTTLPLIDNLLIDLTILQQFNQQNIDGLSLRKNSYEINIGITVLSAWFIPRDNLAF